MTPEIDAAIAKAWPYEWLRANHPRMTPRSRSKARNNIRRKWREHNELEAFKASNPESICANCLSCKPTETFPIEPKCVRRNRVIRDLNDVCLKWETLKTLC